MQYIKFAVMRRAIKIYEERAIRTGDISWQVKTIEMSIAYGNEQLRLARRLGIHRMAS